MNFGQQLKQTRIEHGISLKELSRRTGMSVHDICKYQRGEISQPRERNLRRFSDALGVSIEYWIINKGVNNET